MLPQSRFAVFPPLNVPAGMSVSRKIDLRHFYNLSREGNYHVQAVVKMPNEKDMFASQKALFSIRTGTPMWSQTVSIPGSVKKCKFSVCTIPERGIQKLYIQTRDPETGVAYNAVCVGSWLGTTRPQCLIDGKANVHVFFPTTPTLCSLCTHQLPGDDGKTPVFQESCGYAQHGVPAGRQCPCDGRRAL